MSRAKKSLAEIAFDNQKKQEREEEEFELAQKAKQLGIEMEVYELIEKIERGDFDAKMYKAHEKNKEEEGDDYRIVPDDIFDEVMEQFDKNIKPLLDTPYKRNKQQEKKYVETRDKILNRIQKVFGLREEYVYEDYIKEKAKEESETEEEKEAKKKAQKQLEEHLIGVKERINKSNASLKDSPEAISKITDKLKIYIEVIERKPYKQKELYDKYYNEIADLLDNHNFQRKEKKRKEKEKQEQEKEEEEERQAELYIKSFTKKVKEVMSKNLNINYNKEASLLKFSKQLRPYFDKISIDEDDHIKYINEIEKLLDEREEKQKELKDKVKIYESKREADAFRRANIYDIQQKTAKQKELTDREVKREVDAFRRANIYDTQLKTAKYKVK